MISKSADYYAVFGYDDVGYYYSGPRCNEGKGPMPWDDYGVTNHVGIIYMNAVKKGAPVEDAQAVRDALSLALEEADHVGGGNEFYAAGLRGYDLWIESLETGKADGFGMAYNTVCYAECRANAVAFLKEAKKRLEGEIAPLFDEAITHYEAVAANLRQVAELFPFIGHKPEHIQDPERIAKGIEALNAAKAAEARGLEVLGPDPKGSR